MANNLVLLRLEGPLQSWGEHSKFDFRDSAEFPTKSGIVGMIGCAMGIERNNPELKKLSSSISIGIRCDRQGNISQDFHTVSSNDKILSALGEPRCDTIISRRTYIEDGSFLVAISAEDEVLGRIAMAFVNPVWALYLGRKSCAPSVPVFVKKTDEYLDIEDALIKEPLAARHSDTVTYELESTDGTGTIRTDELSDPVKRLYRERRVIRKTLYLEG